MLTLMAEKEKFSPKKKRAQGRSNDYVSPHSAEQGVGDFGEADAKSIDYAI